MTDYEGEIDKLLEKMHEKVALGWIKNDGKTHTVTSHATGDNCVTESREAILALLNRAAGEAKDRGILLGQAMAHESWMWPTSIIAEEVGQALVDEKPIPWKYARAITAQARKQRDKALKETGEVTSDEKNWRKLRTSSTNREEQK
jgi:hypothetical protein